MSELEAEKAALEARSAERRDAALARRAAREQRIAAARATGDASALAAAQRASREDEEAERAVEGVWCVGSAGCSWGLRLQHALKTYTNSTNSSVSSHNALEHGCRGLQLAAGEYAGRGTGDGRVASAGDDIGAAARVQGPSGRRRLASRLEGGSAAAAASKERTSRPAGKDQGHDGEEEEEGQVAAAEEEEEEQQQPMEEEDVEDALAAVGDPDRDMEAATVEDLLS